jgi:hypothetical protein
MKGVPVNTTMSPLECAVWAAEFARVRAGDSSHGAVGAAIDAADQAVIDLRAAFRAEGQSVDMRTVSPLERAVWAAEFARARAGDSSHAAISAANDASVQAVMDVRDAFGVEHLSLAMRELRDTPDAQLALLKSHLLRGKDDQ